jgi:hypothetical protein
MVRPFMCAGVPRRVSLAGGRLPQWRDDGHELLFQAPAWTRHVFFDLGASFAMNHDGQQFTFRMTATGSTVVMIQNWQMLLK